jgi:hypothetical protein
VHAAPHCPAVMVPFCHVPLELQVCGTALLHWVAPGKHMAPHCPTVIEATCQVPVEVHVSGWLLAVQLVWPGAHATQAPLRHAGAAPVHAAPAFCQADPAELQTCGCAPVALHPTVLGVHTTHAPP